MPFTVKATTVSKLAAKIQTALSFTDVWIINGESKIEKTVLQTGVIFLTERNLKKLKAAVGTEVEIEIIHSLEE